ncbi:hypothetical protein WJX72_002663 [[Myrmecia] bisecta]|uniref:Fe2OG dioxygenase domain-containing protein n=1 Tax=[Myrmecia] bisecta TaxID=41462 RepID=A0AAW1Q9W3_9CHLO
MLFLAVQSESRWGGRGGGPDGTLPWIEQLSWSPRAYVYHNFLSPEECDHIIAKARPQMRKSTVQGDAGKAVVHDIRTSYGTFLRRKATPVLERIERRIAKWTQLDLAYQEDMQILRYGIGQKYGAHYDSLLDGSPRVATVLLYLSNHTLEGGETAFPKSNKWVDPALAESYAPFSKCAQGSVAFKPKQGAALLFYSLTPALETDDAAMHTGCPVLSGIKWTATKWIHTQPFHREWLDLPPETASDPSECRDENEACAGWAKDGECTKNANFMTGDGGLAEAELDAGSQPGLEGAQSKVYEVTLRKPLGMVLAEDRVGGATIVEELVPGGNADKSGVVAAGDVVKRCSAYVLKAGKESEFQSKGHGARPYDNWERIMFDCTGQDFKTVMSAISSNNERWGIFNVTLELLRP